MEDLKNIANGIIEMLKLRGQITQLPELIELLEIEAETYRNEVVIESATELSEKQLNQVAQIIATKLGFEPNIVHKVDPKLLGGVKMYIGDTVVDVSLRNRLEQIKNNIH